MCSILVGILECLGFVVFASKSVNCVYSYEGALYLCFGDLLLKCFGLVVFASKNKSVNYEGALYLLVVW